jgi:imidazolonepropionase-like amidohydrolase
MLTHPQIVSRRRFLQVSAVSAATLAACGPDITRATLSPFLATARPTPTPTPTSTPITQPSTVAGSPRTLYRDAALADGRSAELRRGVSILVENGLIAWIRPADAEEDPGPTDGLEIIDASGTTIVPGMVDCHSHLTMPGGAHWIDRGFDPADRLLAYAEHNARLQRISGVYWARDVGSPRRVDPNDGRERGLAIGLRDRWRGRREYPYVRAAGTWVTKVGSLPDGLSVEASNGDELLAAAMAQLDDDADFIKLYLDGPEAGVAPWTTNEVKAVVDGAASRGAKVTAHSGNLAGARVGVAAGVHSLEHGFVLDADLCRDMATRGTFLVSTLAVMQSWLSFGQTTTLPRFASAEGRARINARLETANESVRLAHAAGVAICAGTDFGGGSTRADHMAWEVESLVAAGLEPWKALGAATWRGGEILGEAEAGSIREGGPADFFLVHGDPLSDPSSLWRVWRTS